MKKLFTRSGREPRGSGRVCADVQCAAAEFPRHGSHQGPAGQVPGFPGAGGAADARTLREVCGETETAAATNRR